jgi:hypothetical protein
LQEAERRETNVRRKRWVSAIASIAILALLGAACGGNGTETDTGTAGATDTPTAGGT